ncbi:hypothetical protein JL722_11106 [Aureococcus anophagefferens]|nr:hypothetical protein JL722_11106 [Aureococcus anophagefferens]
MFLNLWAQVWVLQLLKERRLANASGEPYPLAAAASPSPSPTPGGRSGAGGGSSARALLAVAGLWYLAARGSSSNHIALQAVVCVAVLEASSAATTPLCGALRRGRCEVLGALYLVTALAKCNDGWVDPYASCATLYTVAGAAELRRASRGRGPSSALPYGAPRASGARGAAAGAPSRRSRCSASALPHVGLRTHPCFAMFSNLRVEGGASNHWLFTAERLAALDLGGGAMADGVVVADAAARRRDAGRPRPLARAGRRGRARPERRGVRVLHRAAGAAWPPPGWPPAPAAFEPFGTPWVELRRRVSAAVAADPGLALRVAYERRGERRVFARRRRRPRAGLGPGPEPLRGLRARLQVPRVRRRTGPCRH